MDYNLLLWILETQWGCHTLNIKKKCASLPVVMEFSVKPSHGSACILLVFQLLQHSRWNTWIYRLHSSFDSPLQTTCAIDFFSQ